MSIVFDRVSGVFSLTIYIIQLPAQLQMIDVLSKIAKKLLLVEMRADIGIPSILKALIVKWNEYHVLRKVNLFN